MEQQQAFDININFQDEAQKHVPQLLLQFFQKISEKEQGDRIPSN